MNLIFSGKKFICKETISDSLRSKSNSTNSEDLDNSSSGYFS